MLRKRGCCEAARAALPRAASSLSEWWRKAVPPATDTLLQDSDPVRLLCRLLGSLLLRLLRDNPEIAFANSRSTQPVTRASFRLLSLRPGHQLTAAVRADPIHAGGATRTEGAFVAADARLAFGWQRGPALFARGTHFKRHVVPRPSLRSAAADGGRARRPLRGPHRFERRSLCRSLRGVAASAPAAADI